MADLNEVLRETAATTNDMLDRLLPRPEGVAGRVAEAMRYAALAGGKRLRPFLVTASGGLFDAPDIAVRRTAAAVEIVHCYSLVHDDLPAMDDDEFRRGRPTCHLKFDEATAILAGDAMITLAFGVLCAPETHDDAGVRCELAQGLAAAAGSAGMVGGQMIDLLAEGRSLELDAITHLQALKTGALIAFSCEAGAILGGAAPAERRALSSFGQDIGLAFQIADDLLDVEGSRAEMGKGVGKDAATGKATFVDLLGVDGARDRARALVGQATDRLAAFGEKADLLRQVARFVIDRRH